MGQHRWLYKLAVHVLRIVCLVVNECLHPDSLFPNLLLSVDMGLEKIDEENQMPFILTVITIHSPKSRSIASYCRIFWKTVSFSTTSTYFADVSIFVICAVKCGKTSPVEKSWRKTFEWIELFFAVNRSFFVLSKRMPNKNSTHHFYGCCNQWQGNREYEVWHCQQWDL